MTCDCHDLTGNTELSELMHMWRHWGNIRYLLLPIFLSIEFALFLALDQSRQLSLTGSAANFPVDVKSSKVLDAWVLAVLAWAGILLSGGFIALEWVLDRYITKYRLGAASLLREDSKMKAVLENPPAGYQFTSWVILMIYFGPAIFWIGVI